MTKAGWTEWAWRSGACVAISALALSRLPHAEQWVPGAAFALLVVAGRRRDAGLLAAVLLSYSAGYASGELFGAAGVWPTRVGVVVMGSGLLAASLRWKGGLSLQQSRQLFFIGSVLALPFWWLLVGGPQGAPTLWRWAAAMAVWQMPVAWFYLSESRS